MDWQALKDAVRNAPEPARHQIRKKQSDVVDDAKGYYTRNCTFEPFTGKVIKLSGEDFNLYFQRFGMDYYDEYSFREKLENIDEWLAVRPYKVQQRYETYLTKWLPKKNNRD